MTPKANATFEALPPWQARCRSQFLRHLLQPMTLGFSALAIAVILWGSGYKLSLYHRQMSPELRCTVAKLWIERPSVLLAAKKLRSQTHSSVRTRVLLDSKLRLPHPFAVRQFSLAEYSFRRRILDLPGSLRSPPQTHTPAA